MPTPATPISIREWNANPLPSSSLFPIFSISSLPSRRSFPVRATSTLWNTLATCQNAREPILIQAQATLTSPPRTPTSWKTPRHHFITLLQSPGAAASGTSLKIRLKIGPRVDPCHVHPPRRKAGEFRVALNLPPHGFMLIHRAGVRVTAWISRWPRYLHKFRFRESGFIHG